MELFKEQCKRPGYEKLTDYTLVWSHEGKTYSVRVKPCFKKDYKFFQAHAKDKD